MICRETSGEEFCRFWDKLELNITELNEVEPAHSHKRNYEDDDGAQPHYYQSTV